MKYVLAVLLLCSLAMAQDTVRVITLKLEDGATAYEINQRIARAQKLLDYAQADLKKFQTKVEMDYITVEESSTDREQDSFARKGECHSEDCMVITTSATITIGEPTKDAMAETEAERQKYDTEHPRLYHRKGFVNGFRFSDDFRFIVPAPPPLTTYPGNYNCYSGIISNPVAYTAQ